MFLSKGLFNPDFARKLLSWRYSGFSIESGTRIYDQEARQALSQYIVRPPLSLEKIHWDQDQDTVSLRVQDNGRGIAKSEVDGSKSYGLLGMRERVRLRSGDFTIQGTPGQGTTVVIRLPLNKGHVATQEAP